jgi:hypothetical protein
MNLIATMGKKRSGKDTVFEALRKVVPGAQRRAFADPLYVELALACGVSVRFIQDNKHIFRTALQWWGTDFRRKLFGEDYWVAKMDYELRRIEDASPLVVITDVRFKNEAELVRSHGGLLWRVERPQSSRVDVHQSETEADDIAADRVIDNSGSLEELEQIVARAYHRI